MSNFDTAKWFKNQYLKEHKINENEYDDEDIVIYDGEEHIIMSRDGNMIYIRPLEDSAILGKRDVIKVPARALAYKSDLDKMYDEYKPKDEMNEVDEKWDKIARDEYGKPWMELSIAQKQEMLSYANRETEKEFETDFERRRKGDYSDDMEDGMTDYQRRRMDEGFKVGDKVTYLGHPAVVTATKEYNGKDFVSVSYDKGTGKTKASDILATDGTVKAIKEDMNDPVLMKARAAKMADEKEMAKQAALDKKYGSSFMDKLEAEIDLKNELQDLKDERAQLMIDMEQEAEPEGGEVADRYGSRLNDIDARMGEIKPELEDLRMYESVVTESKGAMNYFSDLKSNYQKAFRYLDVKERKEYKRLAKDFFSKLQVDDKVRAVGLNENSYIRVSKPRFKKDKNNPNFLYVYMDYDTGPGGSSIALGKETMTGQIRRLSSAEAVRQMNDIAKKLNDNFNIEDIEVKDLENGKVQIFAVSDDFIDMDPRSELSMALLNESASTEEKRIATRAIKSIAKYRGVSEDEAKRDLTRAIEQLGSLKEAIKDIKETIKLGKTLNEELCAKGKAYRKRRIAAGEKSSAYLSGRAVKVCKGQMSGKKKKK